MAKSSITERDLKLNGMASSEQAERNANNQKTIPQSRSRNSRTSSTSSKSLRNPSNTIDNDSGKGLTGIDRVLWIRRQRKKASAQKKNQETKDYDRDTRYGSKSNINNTRERSTNDRGESRNSRRGSRLSSRDEYSSINENTVADKDEYRRRQLKDANRSRSRSLNNEGQDKYDARYNDPRTTDEERERMDETRRRNEQEDSGQPLSKEEAVEAVFSGNDTGLTGPEIERARESKKKLETLMAQDPESIADSIASFGILPGSRLLRDLQKYYPEQAQEINQIVEDKRALKDINRQGQALQSNLTTEAEQNGQEFEDFGLDASGYEEQEPSYQEELARQTTEGVQVEAEKVDYAQEYFDYAQEKLNDPEIQIQEEKVIRLQGEVEDFDIQIENIAKDVRATMGSEVPESYISAIIAEKSEDLIRARNSKARVLNTEQAILTSRVENAREDLSIFANKLQMQQQQEAQRIQQEQFAITEQRKAEQEQWSRMLDLEKFAFDQEKYRSSYELDVANQEADNQYRNTRLAFDAERFQEDLKLAYKKMGFEEDKYYNDLAVEEQQRIYGMLDNPSIPDIMKEDIYDYVNYGIPMGSNPVPQANPDARGRPGVAGIGNGKITAYGTNANRRGLDIDGTIGDPIPMQFDSKVVRVGNDPDGRGNYVTVEVEEGQYQGYKINYAHLDKVQVKNGDFVNMGRSVGTLGNTGFVIPGPGGDGSHVDITVYDNQGNKLTAKEAETVLNGTPISSPTIAETQGSGLPSPLSGNVVSLEEAQMLGDNMRGTGQQQQQQQQQQPMWMYDEEVASQQPFNPYRQKRAGPIEFQTKKAEQAFTDPNSPFYGLSREQAGYVLQNQKALFGGNPSEKDIQMMLEYMREIGSDASPADVVYYMSNLHLAKDQEKARTVADAIQTSLRLGDVNTTEIFSRINRNDYQGALEIVENTVNNKLLEREPDYKGIGSYQASFNVIDQLASYEDKAGFVKGRLQGDLPERRQNSEFRAMGLLIDDLETKLLQDRFGDQYTEQQAEMIRKLIPQPTDSKRDFGLKIKALKSSILNELNGFRVNVGLPEFSYETFGDKSKLVDVYNTGGSSGRLDRYQEDPLGVNKDLEAMGYGQNEESGDTLGLR